METSAKVKVYRFIYSPDGRCAEMTSGSWALQDTKTGELLTYNTLGPVRFFSLENAREWCLEQGHGFLDPDN
jgi:hypothetical protein